MRQHPGSRLGLVVAVGIALCATASRAMVTADDQKLIDEAGCEEIVKEYRNHVAAEKAVADEIRQSSSSATKSNAIGLASMAILGIGFFPGTTIPTPKPTSPSCAPIARRSRRPEERRTVPYRAP